MFNKISVCADFLATKESEQANNIRWFRDILSRPILNATGITANEFKSAISERNGFVRDIFFAKSKMDFSPTEMQFDYDAEKAEQNSLDYLTQHIQSDTLVIGYELSSATRRILDRSGITYIDVWLHPVRYLDDVLFAFDSNNKNIKAALMRLNIKEDVYFAYADRLRVQAYKGFRRSKLHLHSDSALFVGQTLYDKAISRNGRMLSLLDFKERFSELCATHDHVYYSRHPFVKAGDEDVLAYVKRHKNVTITDEPSYFLLAADEIKTVASLSSSVAHEAKYFGKAVSFFFQPVVKIGSAEDCYASIYQSFMFAHFWSDILSPIFRVKAVDRQEYFEGKDKIRDMLSFYWGYRNIDKLESLKQTVGSLFEKKNSLAPDSTATPVSDWRSEIERSSIVSFDVFDTLVTRNVYFPTDVFAFSESQARHVTNGKAKNFRSIRMLSETNAREAARANGKQECTISEIYEEVSRFYDLTSTERDNLLQVELNQEYTCSTRRDAGWAMFKYAQKLGKEIIAISDTTHDTNFISRLLSKSGYSGFTNIYVSSECGLRKHEGEIFDFVIDDLNISAVDAVHIGDNVKGDKLSSESRGIRNILIPRASVHLEAAEGYTKFVQEMKTGKTIFDSTLMSIIARNFYDTAGSAIKPKTLFNGDAFNLGFAGLGPVMAGFVTWIYKEAKKSGITDLFFLSRDGLIAKKVFDAMFSDMPNTPSTHYIYASRRAARVATIYCLADILEIANKHIYSTTISKYLWTRFGLADSKVSHDEYIAHGFTGNDDIIGGKSPKANIIAFVEYLKDRILHAADEERENYIVYLEKSGLIAAQNAAVIDIGYAGSMQAALQRITGKNLLGLYYATFSSARTEALDINDVRGYVVNLGQANGKATGIQTHRFIYESIFCAPHDSFICIKKQAGILKPVFDTTEHDDLRHSLITRIHGGVEAFAYRLKDECSDTAALEIEPASATKFLDHWLVAPTIDDALILEGLRFHDPMGPDALRYVVPPRHLRNEPEVNRSVVWAEGLKALQRLKGAPTHVTPTVAIPQPVGKNPPATPEISILNRKRNPIAWLLYPFESKIILKTCNDRKIEKYLRDRRRFFADAKKPLVRAYGRYSSAFM